MPSVDESVLPVFGLIMQEEMRIEGLKEILGDGSRCRLVLLSSHRVQEVESLDLILLDAEAAPLLLQAVDSLRRARFSVRILILGRQAAMGEVEAIIAAGAKGFVPYTASADELRLAVGVVLDGSVWAPRKVLANLLDKAEKERAQAVTSEPHFTAREVEVMQLLVQGRSNREIAQALRLDQGTVKAHLARLMRKAAVDNRTALTMRALQRSWVQ